MIVTLLDTETTDLISNHSMKLDKQPEIIEVYFRTVDLSSGELLSEYETLIKPSKPINEKTTEITGITNEMLKDAPPFGAVADAIARNFSINPIIAHNASFDREMLEFEFERIHGVKPSWMLTRWICTVEATVHLKGFRLGLQHLHEHLFGEKFVDAHRARPDVIALERICIELFKRGDL